MRKFKFHWGHGVMVALGCFMLLILFLVFSVPISIDLVEDDYYEESTHFQDVIDAQKNAQALSKRPHHQKTIEGLQVNFPKEIQVEKGYLRLRRPDKIDKDVQVPLKLLNQENSLTVPADSLIKGRYDYELHWEEDGKAFQINERIAW